MGMNSPTGRNLRDSDFQRECILLIAELKDSILSVASGGAEAASVYYEFRQPSSSLDPDSYDIPIWEPCHESLGQSQDISRTIALSIFPRPSHCTINSYPFLFTST
jgi:hypothetical protein